MLKQIKTLNARSLAANITHEGCGECQASCQSACKTSCTVGNQPCESSFILHDANKNEAKIRRVESKK